MTPLEPVDHKKTVTIAVVQATPVLFDLSASVQKAIALAYDARAKGADLIVFPEAFLCGYPKDLDFGTRLGYRTETGRDQFERYYSSAIAEGDPAFVKLQEGFSGVGAEIIIGVTERSGRSLFCSAFFFDSEGRFRGRHRKLVPTALERIIWAQGDGSTLPVFDTEVGKIGAVICWENYMPLLRTTMYGYGIEFYCAPTVDDRDVWQASMRHIATEGRCFVASACQYLRAKDCPANYEGGALFQQGEDLIRGGSVIVDPRGTILAGPVYGEETILTASCSRADLARGSLDLDVVGHYARPDIFTLLVDHSNKQTVTVKKKPD